MRYKQQIWDFFIKYTDEEGFMKYSKEHGKEDRAPFYDMENEVFYRLLNTFRWLTLYTSPYMRIEETITKPTNSDILEAIDVIRISGEKLMVLAKRYPKGEDLRGNLIKMAKKRVECASYYMQLVEENFFEDKELNLQISQEI